MFLLCSLYSCKSTPFLWIFCYFTTLCLAHTPSVKIYYILVFYYYYIFKILQTKTRAKRRWFLRTPPLWAFFSCISNRPMMRPNGYQKSRCRKWEWLIASLDAGLVWPIICLRITTYISSFDSRKETYISSFSSKEHIFPLFMDVHTCISVLPAVPSSNTSNQRVKCHGNIKYKQCGSTFKRRE